MEETIEVDAYLADPLMAETLRKLLAVDHHIEGLNDQIVGRLEFYQERFKDIKQRVAGLEREIEVIGASPLSQERLRLLKQRLASNQKQKQLIQNQLHTLKG